MTPTISTVFKLALAIEAQTGKRPDLIALPRDEYLDFCGELREWIGQYAIEYPQGWQGPEHVRFLGIDIVGFDILPPPPRCR